MTRRKRPAVRQMPPDGLLVLLKAAHDDVIASVIQMKQLAESIMKKVNGPSEKVKVKEEIGVPLLPLQGNLSSLGGCKCITIYRSSQPGDDRLWRCFACGRRFNPVE